MRALQITKLSGPDAVRLVDIAEPEVSHPLTPGHGVLIDVRAAAVSFADPALPGVGDREQVRLAERVRR